MRYTIPIKPTLYRSIRFRSRLEARWAVFFDCLGISFQYESRPPIRLLVGYLPDFYIPRQPSFPREMYFEVKPSSCQPSDSDKPDILAQPGVPVGFLHELRVPASMFDACEHEIFFGGAYDLSHGFCQCSRCNAFGFEFEGRSERITCPCDLPEEHTDAIPVFVAAYSRAVRYKFEDAVVSHNRNS